MKKKFYQIFSCLSTIFFASISTTVFCRPTDNYPIAFTLKVPIDHNDKSLGFFDLYYEVGYPFDKSKRTIFIISDAQQFYVRKGVVKGLQDRIFGNDFNVVGIVTRANADTIRKLCTNNGVIDWQKAYRLFNSRQYIEDIETVRRKLLGAGKVNLYGLSGGALLTTEYLSVYPKNVFRAFVGAAVNYYIENKLGLWSDTFWQDFASKDSTTKKAVISVLKSDKIDRFTLSMLFQRQNYFASVDSLAFYREKLLQSLINNDTAQIRYFNSAYQVDAVQNFARSPLGIPIGVREFEFMAPLAHKIQVTENRFDPNYEAQYFFGEVLMKLYLEGKLDLHQSFNEEGLRNSDAELFVQAGRYDHEVDYRGSIYLSALVRKHFIFIVNDDHVFKKLNKEKKQSPLIIEFFKLGLKQPDWIYNYKEFKWQEGF